MSATIVAFRPSVLHTPALSLGRGGEIDLASEGREVTRGGARAAGVDVGEHEWTLIAATDVPPKPSHAEQRRTRREPQATTLSFLHCRPSHH